MHNKSFDRDYRQFAPQDTQVPDSGLVRVEDDRTGMSEQSLKRAIVDNLHYGQGKDNYFATP